MEVRCHDWTGGRLTCAGQAPGLGLYIPVFFDLTDVIRALRLAALDHVHDVGCAGLRWRPIRQQTDKVVSRQAVLRMSLLKKALQKIIQAACFLRARGVAGPAQDPSALRPLDLYEAAFGQLTVSAADGVAG